MKTMWNIGNLTETRVRNVRAANYPCRLSVVFISNLFAPTAADVVCHQSFQWFNLPAFGNFADERGDARELFVAGEAEVDEPLAVEGAGHRLQEPDAPLTVLHQLVVGRQDARYPPLHRKRGNTNLEILNRGFRESFPRCAALRQREQAALKVDAVYAIEDKARVGHVRSN